MMYIRKAHRGRRCFLLLRRNNLQVLGSPLRISYLSVRHIARLLSDSFSKHIVGFFKITAMRAWFYFLVQGKTLWKALAGYIVFTLPIFRQNKSHLNVWLPHGISKNISPVDQESVILLLSFPVSIWKDLSEVLQDLWPQIPISWPWTWRVLVHDWTKLQRTPHCNTWK